MESIVFENLTVVAVVIIAMWLLAIGLYLYSSRQNKNISQEIDAVSNLLDEAEDVNA
jgi:hypothetical protein